MVYAVGPDTNGRTGIGYLLKSTDFGQTWSILAQGQDFSGRVTVDPKNSHVLYGSNAGGFIGSCPATNEGKCGLYKSSDGGASWTPAYVYFISPGQLNVLAPDLSPGPVNVTVTTPGGSMSLSVTAGLYKPAFFAWPGSQPVATRPDYSLAAKAGTFAGAATDPAKPGDVLILWATGFGPTSPAAPAGVAVPSDQAYATATMPSVTIDNIPATVIGAALAPGAAGLYQIAIQVPDSLADGDWPIQASIGGVLSPAGTMLTVQH